MKDALVLVGQRLVKLALVLLLVSFATLLLLDLLPGGPVDSILGPGATQEQADALEHDLGLDKPLPERYGEWLGGLARGDLGRSLVTQEKVGDSIQQRLPVTLQLAGMALGTALVSAVPLAVYSAHRAGKRFDRTVTLVSSALLSIPGFLAAMFLVYFLAVVTQWFPVTGWVPLSENLGENLRHAVLPVLSLALVEAAMFTRLLRNDMVATLQQDFILSARARGLPTRRVLFGHALRPSSFSLVTVAGVTLGRLIGGTVIIESIFALPGLGGLALSAINGRDYVVLRGVIVVLCIGYVLVNAFVDLIYPLLDPRLRAGAKR
jgi:peptide/nickel transport system permease protein